MKFAVIVFPGSNCDHDAHYAASHVFGQDAEFVWHKETSLKGADVVILPGGFSHGDYLRTGAIARFSPIMAAVADFARKGGPVLGICNGFQVLLEAGLLPGRDAAQSRPQVPLRARLACAPSRPTRRSPLRASRGQVLKVPIAHGEGNYFADPDVVRMLESTGRVVFRYCDRERPGHRRGQPQRLAQQHRRHLQRGPQRGRPDAASRAGVRGGARQRRRPGDVRVGDRRA